VSPRGRLPVVRDLTLPYALSLLVAGLLAAVSVAGLLYGQGGLYDPDPRTLPTFLGQDGLTLVAGLPLLLVSLRLARRGSLRGLMLWAGSLFYVTYSYAYYVLGARFNPLFLAYVVVVSASGYALLYILLSLDAEAIEARFSARTPVRALGGFLAFMGAFPAAMWVAAIVAATASGATPSAVERVVWPMDLVVAFPALFWGGVWLWRRQALGYAVGGVLLVKAAAVGPTLVLNSWLVTRWGVPLDPMLPFYAFVGAGGLLGTVVYLRAVDPPVSRPVPRAGMRSAA
jgi:hypothetical protein